MAAHPVNPDSCTGVTVYSSFVTVRYDISCGRLSPEFVPTRYSVRTATRSPGVGRGFRTGHRPQRKSGAEPNDLFGPKAPRVADLDRRSGRASEEIVGGRPVGEPDR